MTFITQYYYRYFNPNRLSYLSQLNSLESRKFSDVIMVKTGVVTMITGAVVTTIAIITNYYFFLNKIYALIGRHFTIQWIIMSDHTPCNPNLTYCEQEAANHLGHAVCKLLTGSNYFTIDW